MAEGRVVVDAEAAGVEAEIRNVQNLFDPHAIHIYIYICTPFLCELPNWIPPAAALIDF